MTEHQPSLDTKTKSKTPKAPKPGKAKKGGKQGQQDKSSHEHEEEHKSDKNVSTLGDGPLLDEKQTKCPVCSEYFQSAVFQCMEGHPFCHRCSEKLTSCPVCLDTLTKPRIHNLTLEEICSKLIVPCGNEGCTARVPLHQLEAHETNCLKRPIPCPFCLVSPQNSCHKSYQYGAEEMIAGLKESHKPMIQESPRWFLLFKREEGSRVKNAYRIFSAGSSKWVGFTQFDGHLFRFVALISGLGRLVISLALCQFDEAEFYGWEGRYQSPDGLYTGSFKGPVQRLHKFDPQNGMAVSQNVFAKCLAPKDDNFSFQFEITINKIDPKA